MPESPLERKALAALAAAGLPRPLREYRFHSQRQWRFDLAWPEARLAVECEGGTHSGGRHTRADGFDADCEKYNTAALLGWRVLRVTGTHIADGTLAAWVGSGLGAEACAQGAVGRSEALRGQTGTNGPQAGVAAQGGAESVVPSDREVWLRQRSRQLQAEGIGVYAAEQTAEREWREALEADAAAARRGDEA